MVGNVLTHLKNNNTGHTGNTKGNRA